MRALILALVLGLALAASAQAAPLAPQPAIIELGEAGSVHDWAKAERIPAYPALSSTLPADSNSVTSGPTEVDPGLRAPLPQSCFLGLVRKIVPPFEGARRTSKSL